jgi:hypothetical protein
LMELSEASLFPRNECGLQRERGVAPTQGSRVRREVRAAQVRPVADTVLIIRTLTRSRLRPRPTSALGRLDQLPQLDGTKIDLDIEVCEVGVCSATAEVGPRSGVVVVERDRAHSCLRIGSMETLGPARVGTVRSHPEESSKPRLAPAWRRDAAAVTRKLTGSGRRAP